MTVVVPNNAEGIFVFVIFRPITFKAVDITRDLQIVPHSMKQARIELRS